MQNIITFFHEFCGLFKIILDYCKDVENANKTIIIILVCLVFLVFAYAIFKLAIFFKKYRSKKLQYKKEERKFIVNLVKTLTKLNLETNQNSHWQNSDELLQPFNEFKGKLPKDIENIKNILFSIKNTNRNEDKFYEILKNEINDVNVKVEFNKYFESIQTHKEFEKQINLLEGNYRSLRLSIQKCIDTSSFKNEIKLQIADYIHTVMDFVMLNEASEITANNSNIYKISFFRKLQQINFQYQIELGKILLKCFYDKLWNYCESKIQ